MYKQQYLELLVLAGARRPGAHALQAALGRLRPLCGGGADEFARLKYLLTLTGGLDDLRALYERSLFDYARLVEVLRKQAALFGSVAAKERFYPSHFRVGFYGRGFEEASCLKVTRGVGSSSGVRGVPSWRWGGSGQNRRPLGVTTGRRRGRSYE